MFIRALLVAGLGLSVGSLPTGAAKPEAAAQPAATTEPARDLRAYAVKAGEAALGGHDPVAYFVEDQALMGDEQITLVHRGVTYRFASAEYRGIFERSPEVFEPAFGGWCAYAMAEGEKVKADPTSFRIEDGRLYVFAKGFFSGGARRFDRDRSGTIRRAEKAWQGLSGEVPTRVDHEAEGHSCPLCSGGKAKTEPEAKAGEPAKRP